MRHTIKACFCAMQWALLGAALAAAAPAPLWAADSTIHRRYQGPAHRDIFLAPAGEQVGGYSVVAFPELTIDIPDLGQDRDDADTGLRLGVPLQAQEILLTDRSHREVRVKLKIVGIHARLVVANGVADQDPRWRQMLAAALTQPAGGCSILDTVDTHHRLSWKFDQPRCTLSLPPLANGPTPATLTDIKLAYEIDWDDVDTLPNGTYTGRWEMRIDDQDGLWLGAGASSNDALAAIDMTLTIAHDIQVRAGQQALALQPVGGAWGSSRQNIQGMSASTTLTISSAPAFTVHVTCTDQVENQCALRHTTTTNVAVPLNVQLTLPDVEPSPALLPVFNPGAPSDAGLHLRAERALQNVEGTISFSVNTDHTHSMLSKPGHYYGQLAVVFDASPLD